MRFSRCFSPLSLLCGTAALATLTTLAPRAQAQAIITNGTIKLGVQQYGNLNQAGGDPSASGATLVGLRYLKPGASAELEYTSQGSPWEGWGIAYDGATSGGANYAEFGDNSALNLTFGSFSSTASTATSVSSLGSLNISHAYAPSSVSNLYEVVVNITNTSGVAVNNLTYRRVFDWDVDPTPFDETVEIGGWPASALVGSNNNGFNSADPLNPMSGSLVDQNFGFIDSGFTDQGAAFEFNFGTLAAGATKTFSIFYGANASYAATLGDLSTVGAEVYSVAAPNSTIGSADYSVSAFGFKGVGGSVVASAPEPGTMALLALGAPLFIARRRRK